jgi:hypothetical protein
MTLSINANSSLRELGASIRRLQSAYTDRIRATLPGAMALGDSLRWARDKVEPRKWKPWRIANSGGVTESWDKLCRRLADHRPIIERELAKNPDLTIRGAIKLITPPKAAPPKPAPAELAVWKTLTTEEKTAGIAAEIAAGGVGRLLGYLPPGIQDALADALARVKDGTVKDRDLSARLRAHIKADPENEFAKYIREQTIDIKKMIIRADAVDAPNKRRPALMSSGSSATH